MAWYPKEGTELYTIDQIGKTREILADGSLLCKNVPIARIGAMDYLPYEIGEKGTNPIKVTRNPEDLFNKQVITSFEGVPITIRHPPEWITPDTYAKYNKGFIRNVHRDGDFLIADLVIRDQNAIDKVLKGYTVEVSPGYKADFEQDDGGDWYQKNIVGNHLALVEKGRGGRDVRIGDHAYNTKGNQMVKNRTLMNRLKSIVIKDAENDLDELKKELEHVEIDTEDKKTRDDDRLEHGSTDERLDKIAEMLEVVVKALGVNIRPDGKKEVSAQLGDRKTRDESEEKRKKDEEEGGRKANEELEGEHREEKRLGLRDDESEEKREKDDRRGGYIAEGEEKVKEGRGEFGDACKDEESDAEARAITEDEAEELAREEDERTPVGDAAFRYVAQHTQGIARLIAPSIRMDVCDNYNARPSEKRRTVNAIRRMALDNALRNPAINTTVKRIVGKRNVYAMDSDTLFNVFTKVARKVAQQNNGKTIRTMAADSAPVFGNDVISITQLQKSYKDFWKKQR